MTPPSQSARDAGGRAVAQIQRLLTALDGEVEWADEAADAAVALDALEASLDRADAIEWESHEGMVTVYDCDGHYVGCMGNERWLQLLNEDAALRSQEPAGAKDGAALEVKDASE